jgi:hypothetical protein
MRHIKTTIGIIGIVLTILGWFPKNIERYPWTISFFAPRYAETLSAYQRMFISAGREPPEKRVPMEMTRKDEGFDDLVLVLLDDFTEIKNATSVVKMKIKDIGTIAGGYNRETGESYSGAQPHFELTLKDGSLLSKYVNDVPRKIWQRLLDDKVFIWSSLFFWLGITLSLSSLFIPASASARNK